MSNDRIWIECQGCKNRFLLLKYYPCLCGPQGPPCENLHSYVPFEDGGEVEAFVLTHMDCFCDGFVGPMSFADLGQEPFKLVIESLDPNDGMAQSKLNIFQQLENRDDRGEPRSSSSGT